MNKIGFKLGNYGNNTSIEKVGDFHQWDRTVDSLLGLRDEYDLENLMKKYLDEETISKVIFDSESSWFVVMVRFKFDLQAEAIVKKFNEALKQAITDKMEEILL